MGPGTEGQTGRFEDLDVVRVLGGLLGLLGKKEAAPAANIFHVRRENLVEQVAYWKWLWSFFTEAIGYNTAIREPLYKSDLWKVVGSNPAVGTFNVFLSSQ